MSTGHVLIQGVPVPPGQAPGLRQEFSAWATETPQNNIQVSLFIRALQKFYDTSYDQTLSYFQVAGIHGYPGNLPWDNSAPPSHRRDAKHMIYCTHNLITFPTWHRPYMALFEQTLYNLMEKVIGELSFPNSADKQDWVNESKKWRLPYWDWALPSYRGKVPELFMPPSVNIRVPAAADGSQLPPENVSNPLYRYQLKVDGVPKKMGDLPAPYTVDSVTLSDGTVLPWAQCSGTSRWGINSTDPNDWSDGVNNYASIEAAISAHDWYGVDPSNEILRHPASDLVYRLLSNVTRWANFSTTRDNPINDTVPWVEWISLEYIHNNLHGFIGGDGLSDGVGHMQNVPAAAFDPIFYMHHCNIDRLLAIWQTLHSNSWWQPTDSPPASDKLTPFHHQFPDSTIDYFDSNAVRDWTKLGYQYDVLQRDPSETDAAYLARIHAWVERTYASTGRVLLGDRSRLFTDITADAADRTYDDYLIDVLYDRYALGGDPYTIHFFLGALPLQVPGKASTRTGLIKHPRHVGSVYNFSTPMTAASAGQQTIVCANCQQQHDDGVLSSAQVPLTIPLYNAAGDPEVTDIQNMDPEAVALYLKDQLSWVAVTTGGDVIPWERLTKTKVYVLRGRGKHYQDDSKLSVYKDYVPLAAVTDGKDAGASFGDYA